MFCAFNDLYCFVPLSVCHFWRVFFLCYAVDTASSHRIPKRWMDQQQQAQRSKSQDAIPGCFWVIWRMGNLSIHTRANTNNGVNISPIFMVGLLVQVMFFVFVGKVTNDVWVLILMMMMISTNFHDHDTTLYGPSSYSEVAMCYAIYQASSR